MKYGLVLQRVLSFLLLLIAIDGFSQDAVREKFIFRQDCYTTFKNFSVNDGLSSNLILDIIQDKYGIMWFATGNGLTRYDGHEFAVYRNQEGVDHSISGSFVTSLAEDSYGNLWVGTRDGLNRYDRELNRFTRYVVDRNSRNSIRNNYIKALYADSIGCLWVETGGGFLSKLDVKSETWAHQHSVATDVEGDYYYHHIFEDSKGDLWVCGRGKSLKKIPAKNIDAVQPMQSSASCCVETLDGGLYFGTYNLVFERYSSKADSCITVGSNGVAATSAVCDRHNVLWFGGKGGLALVDLSRKKITQLRHSSLNPQSLASEEVFCLYKDRNDCIWVGTDKGVSLYSENLNAFKHYRQVNRLDGGMTANAVTALMQDNDGLVWVGTAESGVDTFSLEYEKFGNLSYNLLDKRIDRQTFDRENLVLRQYFRHNAIYTKHKSLTEDDIFGSYRQFQQAPILFASINENRVSALYQDKEGKVYIGLWTHLGFNVYDKEKKEFKRYALWGVPTSVPFPYTFSNPFGANWYTDFLEDSNGTLWCTTWESTGLNIFDRKKGAFLPKHYVPANRIQKRQLFRYAYDSTRHRMILALGGYYGYYDFRTQSFTRYSQRLPAHYPNKDLLEQYFVYSNVKLADFPLETVCLDLLFQDDVVWLASSRFLIKHTLADGKFKVLAREDNDAINVLLAKSHTHQYIWVGRNSQVKQASTATGEAKVVATLANEAITALHEDSSGTLWIGTANGIYFYDPEKDELAESKLGLTNITSIAEDEQNRNVYVGCSAGLAKLKHKKIAEWYAFSYPEPRGIPGGSILSIYVGSSGTIWICTDDGLAKLNSKTKEIVVFHNNPNEQYSLPDNSVLYVCEDGGRNLWVSTAKGACLLEHESAKFIDLTVPNDKTLASRLQHCLLQDSYGNLWIGSTQEGISVLNLKTERFKHYSYQSWNDSSLSDSYIYFMFEDSRSTIWVGSRKGLNRYSREEDSFIRMADLSGYHTYNMQEDASGNLWVSTNNGILCLDSLGNIVRKYVSFPGLQSNEFSLAGCKLSNGSIAFGGDAGFNIFNPESLHSNNFKPKPIVFSNLIVNDSVRCFDLNGLQTLKLASTDNTFSITFCSTDYEYANLISYRYKLEGVDEGWTYTKAPALTAKYSRVPYGHHTFVVEVSGCFGEWVGVEKRLAIHIATPWYYRWWFFTLLAMLFAGVVYTVIRIRERQLKVENIRLEKVVEERTGELRDANQKLQLSEKELKAMNDSKNKLFSIISHDLRNPLKALKVTIRSLYEQYDSLSEEEKHSIISTIHQAVGQTGVLLENLLTWVVSQMNLLRPNLKKTDLCALLNASIELMQLEARKKNIRLAVKIPPQTYVLADENLLSTIFRNLISNAIHYSYPGSEVTVTAKEKDGVVEVAVADKGVGISKEDLERIFSPGSKLQTKGTANEQGTGLGLIITREFVLLHGGSIWVESSPDKGSTFIFTLQKYRE